MHVTVGKENSGKRAVQMECKKNGELEQIDNENQSFFMVTLLEGKLSFSIRGMQFLAEAPCFLCFDETEAPKFEHPKDAEYFRIYFHPVFLNVNMTFLFIRSASYESMAQAHNLFLLKPFLERKYIVPISNVFCLKVQTACERLEEEAQVQPDWYWSCRCRSYFMEIMIVLERMNYLQQERMKEKSHVPSEQDKKLQEAIDYMEGHYSEPLTLKVITEHCGLNHTTLTALFKREKGMTAIEYLMQHRIKVAKKHLAFTELSLKEIADRCGFKTVSHFSRVFKERTGETPMVFRSMALKKRKKIFSLKK